MLLWVCLKLLQVVRGRDLSCYFSLSPLSKFPDEWRDPTSSPKIPRIVTSLIIVCLDLLFNFSFGSKLLFMCPSGENRSSSLYPAIFFSPRLLALESSSTLWRRKRSELFQMLFISLTRDTITVFRLHAAFFGSCWVHHLTITHSSLFFLLIGDFHSLR